jgi:predicted nucleic acid-binding protein
MNGIKYLLDTNVIIGLLKAQGPAIGLVGNRPLKQCAVSQITRLELLGFSGLSTTDEQVIHRFLGYCQVLMLEEKLEPKIIELRRGRSCKLPDAIIAATALVHGLQLLTLDQRFTSLINH